MPAMTSADEPALVFQPLPRRTADRSAAYEALLSELVDLVGGEPPAGDEAGARPASRHTVRMAVGKAVTCRADEGGPIPEEWFDPLIRAAVLEPDPSHNRQLVQPALIA